jgi:hypothetical protein
LNKGGFVRYQPIPLVVNNGQMNIKDEVLAGIWNQMVSEQKAQKVFYNGYITSVYDFINFMRTGGVLPVLIVDSQEDELCHIAWISDYGDGHACLHHCSLGKFRRGAAKAILKYYGEFKNTETGEFLFDTMVGITPENNEAAVRVARLMGFKLLSPAIPGLCNDVYAGNRVGGIISYYQYNRGAPMASHADKGDTSWAAERAAAE